MIREANDDGRKVLQVLREHYQGKGKPRIITFYTKLTSLQMTEDKSTTDYIIGTLKPRTWWVEDATGSDFSNFG